MAAERPDLVVCIALIEGGWAHAGVILDSWEQFTGLLTKPEFALKGATLESVRDYYRAPYPDWPEASIKAAFHSLRVDEDGSLAPRLPAEQREAIMRSIWDDPPAQWFSAVKVPVLLMPAIPKPERRWKLLFTRRVRRGRLAEHEVAVGSPHAEGADAREQRPLRVRPAQNALTTAR